MPVTIVKSADSDFAAKVEEAARAAGLNPNVAADLIKTTAALLWWPEVVLEVGGSAARVRLGKDESAPFVSLEEFLSRLWPELEPAWKPVSSQADGAAGSASGDDPTAKFIAAQKEAASKIRDPLESASNGRSA